MAHINNSQLCKMYKRKLSNSKDFVIYLQRLIKDWKETMEKHY